MPPGPSEPFECQSNSGAPKNAVMITLGGETALMLPQLAAAKAAGKRKQAEEAAAQGFDDAERAILPGAEAQDAQRRFGQPQNPHDPPEAHALGAAADGAAQAIARRAAHLLLGRFQPGHLGARDAKVWNRARCSGFNRSALRVRRSARSVPSVLGRLRRALEPE